MFFSYYFIMVMWIFADYTSFCYQILNNGKKKLLECSTPEAVTRLKMTSLAHAAVALWNVYFEEQRHSSLADFLTHVLRSGQRKCGISAQVGHRFSSICQI